MLNSLLSPPPLLLFPKQQERSGLSNVLPPPPKAETDKLPRALRNMLAFKVRERFDFWKCSSVDG